jgi:hypothetical protein
MLSITRARRAARHSIRILVALAALAGAACERSPSTAAGATPAVEDTIKAVVPKYSIQYPPLAPELTALERAMHVYADGVQKKFDADVAARNDHAAAPSPHLNLEFTVATRTQDFVSALASGEIDLGDAHPQPLGATFTVHLPSAKTIKLDDLFGDPATAVGALSEEARRRLRADGEARLRQENLGTAQFAERLKAMRSLVEQGTEPTAQNFSSFLIDGVDGKAIGLSLQFQPGQVADAAQGMLLLEVPAKIFYAKLKPEYQDAFAVDKEDIKSIEAPVESK